MTGVDQFRQRLADFLARELPADWQGIGALPIDERPAFKDRWRAAIASEGFLGMAWPKEYGGGGLSVEEQSIVQEEFARAGVPHMPWNTDGYGFNLIGPTLLHWGTEEQKAHYLPRIIDGSDKWCQGYSEPEAGSDLFSVRTRAEVVGDEFVINGQKCWQTSGAEANWIFVLARTGTREERAKGITLILVPLEQEGVTVRPIRTMTGVAEFVEVFFDNARTPVSNAVGPVGEGARVALTLLGFERGTASGAMYALHTIELERLTELVHQYGRADDPSIRQRLAWAHEKVEMLGHMGRRVLERALSGEPPGPESSVLKLYSSQYHARLTELAVDVLGIDSALLEGDPAVSQLGADPLGSPNSPHAWLHKFMVARAAVIYGGSSQIQRTTLGERVLGLPREPKVAAATQ